MNVTAERIGPRRADPAWGRRRSTASTPISLAVSATTRRVLARGAA